MQEESPREPGPVERRPSPRRVAPPFRLRAGAIVALAAAVGFVIWLVIRNGDDEASPQPTRTTSERTVEGFSEQDLRDLADSLDGPVYWAGPQAGITYEVTRTPSGRIFVRYLPEGADVGTEEPHFFVATFPLQNALGATVSAANQPGSVKISVGGGAVAFYSQETPSNVYVAFPDSDYQIEVYDPKPERARQAVERGEIAPVSGSAAGVTTGRTVAAADQASLQALPSELGHPVYWAGRQSGTTYELTKTVSGRIFIRYLPKGVDVGSEEPYLFVATFPIDNAFAATQGVAERADSVKIPIGGGGIAFYSMSSPTNVYMAFPDSDVQIQVFDPDPDRVQELVRSGQIRPIG